MLLSWKGCLFLALFGVVLGSQPAMSAKIERFTDKEGTVHISNAGEAEPGKPGVAPPATPIGTLPPQQIFPAAPAPAPPGPRVVAPSPAEPPEMSADEGEPSAEPPAAEAGEEAQPVPAPPGQGMDAQNQ